MTPEIQQSAAPEPTSMGAFARVTGVIFEPKKTFEDIARKPTFLFPAVLVAIFSIAFVVALSQRIGWETVVRQQLDSSSQAQKLTAEQREQQVAVTTKIEPIAFYAGSILGPPIFNLIIAGVLLGIAAGMMSAPIKFKQMFAISYWAGIPTLISTVLTIVVMYLKSPEDFNLKNPLAFNLGAFLEPNMPTKFINSVATSLDLFVFWIIFLLAVGIKAAAGKKFSFGSALTAVLLPWAVVVIVKGALTAVFS